MKEQEVLDWIKKDRIFELDSKNFTGRLMTIDEMVAIFDYFGAFWQYQGKPCPEKPHALLKSGLHSNGFLTCKDVLQYPQMCGLFANEIFKVLWNEIKDDIMKIDVVVSSAYSAITLGWEVARVLSIAINPKIEYIPVEKDEKSNPTVIRGGINPEKSVLVVNELMTTGSGSTWETKQAVLRCNGDDPAPKIIEPAIVLVHRSKDTVLPDKSSVKPVFHFDIENYSPEECPYCKVGSQAIKPKIGNNWARLKYEEKVN